MTRKNRNALLIVLAFILAAYATLVSTYFVATREFAVAEADKLIENVLLTHRALHGYIEEVQKPEIYRLKKEGHLYEGYFSPKVLSNTYAARGVEEYLNRERAKSGLPEVYFKLATKNPFNPINLADEREAGLLDQMNAGTIKKFRQVEQSGGKSYLYFALPTQPNKASCLRCHGDPADAPKELLDAYGTKTGFYEQGDVIRAIISIRVPLDHWLQEARQRAYGLSGITLVAMAVVFAAFAYFIGRMDRAQTRLVASEADLRQINTELNTTLTMLKDAEVQLIQAEKMASIGHLAAGVAHEINNPAGFVNSNLKTLARYVEDLDRLLAKHQAALALVAAGQAVPPELLDEIGALCCELDLDFLREDVRQLLSESTDGMARIRKIVGDLKAFSSVDRVDGIAEVDLNEIIDQAITVAWNDLKDKAEVTKDFGRLPPLRCRPGPIGQVFLNLLVNAAQAIETRGTITVRTEAKPDCVVATVTDNGCGIAADVIGKIFDPFFTTREVGAGAGLGLNVAYNIVRTHGGTLRVASAPGAGATFTVELPLSA